MSSPNSAAALTALEQRLGRRLSTHPAMLEQHGRDEAHLAPRAPDGVAFPRSANEVAEIVRICAAHRLPVIGFGAGTSLEGQVIPHQGGLSVDFSEMNAVLAVHAEDLDAVVQPGVRRMRLNEELRHTGLMFTVDPGADASLGGMASTRASGANAVRYGSMRENVLALEVVLADGSVIRTGSRAKKSAAGYDLTRLFVGAEGTLGLITELTVRLHGAPEAIAAATCAFESVEGAVDTVIAAIQSGSQAARLELLDAVQIRGVNAHSGLGLPEAPHLFLEFHGTEASIAEEAERVRGLAAERGGSGFQWATQAEDRNRLWKARYDAYYANKALRPGSKGYVTDICVPISELAGCIRDTKAELEKSFLIAPLVGHVGDGNFHLTILIDPEQSDEKTEAERIAARLAERALACGGTVTGEHGVGLGKKRFMSAEHGDAIAAMRAIKRAFDPEDLFNPGKIFDLR